MSCKYLPFTANIECEWTGTDDRFCLELFALRYVDLLRYSRGTRGLMSVSLWSSFLGILYRSFSLLFLAIHSKLLDLSCKSLLHSLLPPIYTPVYDYNPLPIRSRLREHQLTPRILPTTLLPLHLLSLPSLLSTLSSLLLIAILLLDGILAKTLTHPATTNIGPEWKNGNWLGGVGLVLAGFGGHAVVPGLARDMKHPGDFERVINRAFVSHTRVTK
jgi:hypothetical protein